MTRILMPVLALAAMVLANGAAAQTAAPEDYASWPVLKSTFPSTGGRRRHDQGLRPGDSEGQVHHHVHGGGARARGAVYFHAIEFDAVPAQGGTLCTDGQAGARSTAAPPAPRRTACSSRTACSAVRRDALARAAHRFLNAGITSLANQRSCSWNSFGPSPSAQWIMKCSRPGYFASIDLMPSMTCLRRAAEPGLLRDAVG